MNIAKKNLYALFLSGIWCITLLSGCASEETSSVSKESTRNTQEGGTDTTAKSGTLGTFSMQDIEGSTYTQEMFADYDLTMVNVFTTWCTPCINEIPDLQKLQESMKDQNIQVVGIVLDGIGSNGKTDEETVEKAKLLAKRTGASYPFLIPDSSYLNGRLANIEAVPETFFVDKNGNIVGDTYSGSRSLDDWTSIVEKVQKDTAQ